MSTEEDPRFVRSKDAILTAARELLVSSGPTAVTHALVAERAKVGRATVYRHWPRSVDLLAEAMATVPLPFFDAPTVPTREWLHTELTALARQLESAEVRSVSTTLASTSLWDESMNARRELFATTLTARLAAALDEAQARGELTLAIDPASAAASVIGPLYYRSTIERRLIDGELVDAAIAALGAWWP